MKLHGPLAKMLTELAEPAQYTLRLGEQRIPANELLGKKITLSYAGEIHCIHCGRKTAKSFQQGFCFPCLRRLQECNLCVIHPERCLVETGSCPQDDWAHQQCHQQHIVYLANSSALKVGITRFNHQPNRWIDQGATQALAIFTTANRYQAGLVEVALKNYVNDKTNWRKMLSGEAPVLDLIAERDNLLKQATTELAELQQRYANDIVALVDSDMLTIHYPVTQYPTKIRSWSFDKIPEISGVLHGIKGQYLLLDTGVLNIRKFGGYLVEVVC